MNNAYTAILKNEGEWWVGWVEEVPGVNAQERSRDELLVSLKEALDDILELNRADSRQSVAAPYEEVTLRAGNGVSCCGI
jgi:predicted RNase H-like HicB family nuclease